MMKQSIVVVLRHGLCRLRHELLPVILFYALWLGAAVTGAAAQPLKVEGFGFTVEALHDKALAFGNRQYVLSEVPPQLSGWQFTRLNGGEQAVLIVTPAEATELFIFASPKSTRLLVNGWTPVASAGEFSYSAGKRTPLAVFSKTVPGGKPIHIPQYNWAGSMLAAPQIGAIISQPKLDHREVPGVVINHLPASSRCYVGSPSIIQLPDGRYVASHDLFGPGSTGDVTLVFSSSDHGQTWQKRSEVHGQFWSTLFFHQSALYLIGPNRQSGAVVIRRSTDGGDNWTTPTDGKSGLLLPEGRFHCGPMPVIEHHGRLWRAMEGSTSGDLRAFMMSIPIDADLLDASNWTCSHCLAGNRTWLGGEFDSWREGNAVADLNGQMLDILRVDTLHYPEKAAIVHISDDGCTTTFDPAVDFLDLPGGSKKFTIRFDPLSKLYWSLVSGNGQPGPDGRKPSQNRNVLVLVSSPDLRRWTIRRELLAHPDVFDHGFQYVDWQFDGDHLIAACRTACDDGLGGADNFHNANYLTFHRVSDFRH